MQFLRDTRDEMRKVTTPSRAEVQSTTIVVVVAVFLFAAYFELVDLVVGKGIDQLFLHLTKH
jgi:preprotein translocase subunit SecE